jgi:AhpD family alkylhydroperoxidase
MKEKLTQQQVYDLALEAFGVVPGIVKEAAERSVELAYLYANGIRIMENASFNAIEMNAIELKISALNHCESCIKGHSYLLKREGLSEEDIQAIIGGTNTGKERLNILLQATDYVFHAGGSEYPDYVLDFIGNNLSEKELADIIGLISIKTISNYLNNYLHSVKKRNQYQNSM